MIIFAILVRRISRMLSVVKIESKWLWTLNWNSGKKGSREKECDMKCHLGCAVTGGNDCGVFKSIILMYDVCNAL